MQINRTNYNPTFQGVKVQTLINKQNKVIDIYKINSEDKTFIDRMLNVAKGQKFPQDDKAIGNSSSRIVYDNALKKAKTLSDKSHDKVLIAIEDGNKISGIINIGGIGDQYIQGLTSWSKNSLVRKGLVSGAMQEVMKNKEEGIVIKAKNLSKNLIQYFRNLGFHSSSDYRYKELAVEYEDLNPCITQLGIKTNSTIKRHIANKHVDMAEVLKLDE